MAIPQRGSINTELYVDGKRDDGLLYLKVRLQDNREQVSNKVKNVTARAATLAAAEMKRAAPKSKPKGLKNTGRLKASIKLQATPAGIVSRGAGGAGGGAGYTAKVVAGENVPYMRYVVEGTGVHGPKKKRIFPKTKKAMSFRAGYIGDLSDIREGDLKQRARVNYGEPLLANRETLSKKSIYRNNAIAYSTRGQKPNQEWITTGQNVAKRYIQGEFNRPKLNIPPNIKFIR